MALGFVAFGTQSNDSKNHIKVGNLPIVGKRRLKKYCSTDSKHFSPEGGEHVGWSYLHEGSGLHRG